MTNEDLERAALLAAVETRSAVEEAGWWLARADAAEAQVAMYRESARLAEVERVADQEEIATLRADRDEARAEVAMLRGSELVADLHAARADRDMLLAAIAEWHEVGSAPPGPDESAAELARWRRALSALTAIATRHPSPERIADVRANLVPSQARVVAKLAAGAGLEERVSKLEAAARMIGWAL